MLSHPRITPLGGHAVFVAKSSRRWLLILGLVSIGLLALRLAEPSPAAPPAHASATAVDFSRHILPILSENCFACHGPDPKARKAKMRLDIKEGAFGKLRNGDVPIVPGKPAESAVIERITATDPDEMMPPPKSGKKLKPEQIALIRKWVEQGAPWSKYWAFVPPTRPPLPQVSKPAWPRSGLDYFILARLDREGLRPSPEADRVT